MKLAVRNSDKLKVAVKIINRRALSKGDEIALRQEVSILMSLDHPNIVKAIDFFEASTHFYFVLEYLSGGELFERLLEKSVYSEEDARNVALMIANALKYCHERDVVHRSFESL